MSRFLSAACVAVAIVLVSAQPGFAVTGNLAPFGTANQSSTAFGGDALRGIDGNTNGVYGGNSVTHTDNMADAFWQVDLGDPARLDSITLHNRADCCGGRLGNFTVSVLDAMDNTVFSTFSAMAVPDGGSATFDAGDVVGQKVRVQFNGPGAIPAESYLALAEVEVNGAFAPGGANFVNLARNPGVTAAQSSTGFGGEASRGVDGNTSGVFGHNGMTHTNDDLNAFWEVDLGSTEKLEMLRLFNRTECCGIRLSNYTVTVFDGATPVFEDVNAGENGAVRNIVLPYGVEGDRVRVQLNGTNNEGNGFLSIAEMQVFGGDRFNVARNPDAVASQSSTAFGGDASRAIDGNVDGIYGNASVSHTDTLPDSFWQVDLGDRFLLDQVVLHNRADCCGIRLSNFELLVEDDGMVVYSETFFAGAGSVPQGDSFLINLPPNTFGDLVRVQLAGLNNEGNGWLSLAEVQVFGGVIPEPMTATLALLGLAALATRRRRAA